MHPAKTEMKTKPKGKKRALRLLICLGLLGMAFVGRSCFKNTSVPGSIADGTLPREETLYMNGIIHEPPTHFNPYNAEGDLFGITPFNPVSNQLIYETLFIYNPLDGKLYPQLGETYTWNGLDMTIILNKDVTFSDGQPMTAADVVNSYELQKKYQTAGTVYWRFIEEITAINDHTLLIKSNPTRYNPKQIEASLCAFYITPKRVWDSLLSEIEDDPEALVRYPNRNPIGTGPYKLYLYNETQVVLQRVDTYWGQTPSKYGKLPVPKYIAHRIFSDRDSEEAAFRRGEVDVSQQFIPQVGELRESNPQIKTYLSDTPYYLPATIPFLVFNTKRPGLDELAVRKAIAMSLDYNLIGQQALSNYTAPMTASLMLPNPLEQSLIDADALKPYQWRHGDVEGANALLDQAGWMRSPTGIRTKGGVRLSFTAECLIGSFDGQTALEIISQSSKAIGIDIKPTVSAKEMWQDNQENGTFDMTIHSYGGPGPASPWNRAYQALDSADLPPEGIPNPIQNWGRWINPVAQDLIARLTLETDPAVLIALWTQLNILYLQNLPCVGLMYRPLWFHTVNTSIWEGFPLMDDGLMIPPTLCTDGYGIRALYRIKPKT